MLNLFENDKQSKCFYTQEQLFNRIVINCFKNYPEIALLVNNTTDATSEGFSATNYSNSWTNFLTNEGLLEKSSQKHIELERTLHSLVCFELIMDGSEEAYNYWIQNQHKAVLSSDSFNSLHNLAKNYEAKIENFMDIIKASLVYSDLGKSQIIKNLAIEEGINIDDHDDLMCAIFSSNPTIREKIIPSFNRFPENIQQTIVQLYICVPIHWGYFLQLEGGESMFTKLLSTNQEIPIEFLNLNFLVNICDIAGALAHVSPLGSLTFNEQVWGSFRMISETIEQFLKDKDPKKAYLDLMNKKANNLGYSLNNEEKENFSILTRIGFFLRFYTEEEGKFLKTYSYACWSQEDWELVKKSFGINSGINTWQHHPTYIPAVLLNLFNSEVTIPDKYQKALNGVLLLAKIIEECQKQDYHNLDSPLCFNKLAAQFKVDRQLINKKFDVTQINLDDKKNLTISISKTSLKNSLKI